VIRDASRGRYRWLRGFVSTMWPASSSRVMNGKDGDLGGMGFAGGLGFWISHMVDA
jgi:hypothetical protein